LDQIPAKITVIIDACYSGSALSHLGQSGREVYVACGADELSTGEYDRRFAEALDIAEADVDGDGVVEMWEADRWGRGTGATVWVCMNVRTDTDGDGLSDDLEQNVSFWKSLGVPDNELPNWEIPDIYVELDWMESAEHNIDGPLLRWLWFSMGGEIYDSKPLFYTIIALAILFLIGTAFFVPLVIAFLICCVIAQLIYSKYKSDSSIKEIFLEHNIKFHLDDGSWGDGIGYDSNDPLNHIGGGMVAYEVPDYGAGEEEGWWGSAHDYFSHIRNEYFFYCLFTRSRYRDNLWGEADYSGINAEFWVDSSNSTDRIDLADLFLHELGHCIILEIDEDHLDPNHQYPHCIHEDCTMWWGNNEANSVNYCDHCWNELVKNGVAEGSIPEVYRD